MFEGTLELRHAGISLTLENCDFFVSDANPLGYTQDPNNEGSVPTVSLLPGGGVSILKVPSKLRQFNMELVLTYQKAATLQAILLSHQERIENKEVDAEILIVDQRIPIMEKTPRVRARKGASLTELTLPAGFERFYPLYLSTLSCPEIERAFFTNDLTQLTVTGHEIAIAPLSLDEA